MTLADNSNALLQKRKLWRKNQSFTRSPSLNSSPSNLNVTPINKDNNVKSHSNAKRIYRSGEESLSGKSARVKTRDEIEFEKKFDQLNNLNERPPTRDDFSDFNYMFDNEGQAKNDKKPEKNERKKEKTQIYPEEKQERKREKTQIAPEEKQERKREKTQSNFEEKKERYPKEKSFHESKPIKKTPKVEEQKEAVKTNPRPESSKKSYHSDENLVSDTEDKNGQDDNQNDFEKEKSILYSPPKARRQSKPTKSENTNSKKPDRNGDKITKATNWNDDDVIVNSEDDNDNYRPNNSRSNGQAAFSIQKSLNMYRFKK